MSEKKYTEHIVPLDAAGSVALMRIPLPLTPERIQMLSVWLDYMRECFDEIVGPGEEAGDE